MEAYFNELSLCFFPNNQTAKDAFELLGRCLKKLSEMQVNNIRMTAYSGAYPFTFWQHIKA